MFKKILVPIDFSAMSTEALRLAVSLVRDGGEVALLNVGVLPDPSLAGSAPNTSLMLEIAGRMAASRGAALAALRGREVPPDVPSSVHLRDGKPEIEIIAAAEELGCDLVVLGTHGRRGLEHFVLGSVAERVARGSTVPVMVTRIGAPSGAV